MSMIEVSHLTKRYRDRVAVDDLSFSVAEGRFWVSSAPTAPGKPPPCGC